MAHYFFRIDGMMEHPQHTPIVDDVGRWWPPKKYGGNLAFAGQHIYGQVYYCNGQKITGPIALPTNPPNPQPAVLFKTYSVYHDQDVIWIADGDATATQVGDGENTPAEAGYSGQRSTGWRLLTFDHDDHDYSSHACYTAGERKLQYQRSDQKWVNMLFPKLYHADIETETKPGENTNAHFGGLTGDLPLFLALMMFSLPPTHGQVMPSLFQDGRWLHHNYPHGRVDRRGVVVRVWSWPPHSTKAILETIEDGTYGKYFY